MSEQTFTTHRLENRRHSGIVGGAILISIGLFALVEQFVPVAWGLYFLPILAGIFLLAGILERRPGLLIPGGILAGVGAGAIAVQSPFLASMSEPTRGGLFMLIFACGWAVITGASYLVGRVMLWPLIPGAFMGLFGLALLAGNFGPLFITLAGLIWPLGLIALGLYMVLRRRS